MSANSQTSGWYTYCREGLLNSIFQPTKWAKISFWIKIQIICLLNGSRFSKCSAIKQLDCCYFRHAYSSGQEQADKLQILDFLELVWNKFNEDAKLNKNISHFTWDLNCVKWNVFAASLNIGINVSLRAEFWLLVSIFSWERRRRPS